MIQAYEMAPKKAGEAIEDTRPKKEKPKGPQLSFDYSKWNALEKEMMEDENIEERIRENEMHAMKKKKPITMEEMGPESFGLPGDTPWPPPDPGLKRQGPFDYSRWDKVVEEADMHSLAEARYEYLQRNPQYEWKNGEKMRIIF